MIMPTKMDMSKIINKLIQSKGFKIKVNKNSYLVFESKQQYRNIKRLEENLFDLVRNVLTNGINEEIYERERSEQKEAKLKTYYRCGCEDEYESESESESEKFESYNRLLRLGFKIIEKKVKEFPLMEVNVFELEKTENLDDPFEIKFPTLVYFFMIKHKKEEGYSNYKLFCKKIKLRDLELNFKDLRRIIREVIQIK